MPAISAGILRAFEAGESSSAVPRRETRIRAPLPSRRPGGGTFGDLDAQSAAEVGELLERLRPAQRTRLVTALRTAETLLGERAGRPAWRLRAPHPGDMGLVVARQAALYAEE